MHNITHILLRKRGRGVKMCLSIWSEITSLSSFSRQSLAWNSHRHASTLFPQRHQGRRMVFIQRDDPGRFSSRSNLLSFFLNTQSLNIITFFEMWLQLVFLNILVRLYKTFTRYTRFFLTYNFIQIIDYIFY